jgi:hypothetical protein
MNTPITGLPGIGTARTAHPREVLAGNAQLAQYIPNLCVIDGTRSRDALNGTDTDVLRAGLVLGKTTAGGKYAPSILGVTTAAAAAAATSLSVAPAVAAELLRRVGVTGTFKLVGPPTAGGTVATQTVTYTVVNTVSGAITVNALGAAAIAGSFVQPTDGSEAPITLMASRWGQKVTDVSGASTDTLCDALLLAGHVKTANLVNYPTDTSLVAWLKAALRTNCPALTFDDAF